MSGSCIKSSLGQAENDVPAAVHCSASPAHWGARAVAKLRGSGHTAAERRKTEPHRSGAVAADGKPDLTGVWLHEVTPTAEFKRMLGASYEAESQAALIGMELESVHKYALNI